MVNDSTWVKLYRKSLANDIRRHDPTAWRLFETLLLLVDSRTGKWSGGIYQLTEADGFLKSSTIYKALDRLEESGMITKTSNTRYSEISICNFATYAKTGNTSSVNQIETGYKPSNTLTRSKNKEVINIYKSSKKEEEILNVLNEVTGRGFRAYPNEARTRNTAKLFSPEEVRKALERMKLDEWHKPRMKQLSSGYLLATQNIDKFLNYKTAAETYLKQTERTKKPQTSSLSRSEINKLEYLT